MSFTYPKCQAESMTQLEPCPGNGQFDGIHKVPHQDVWLCGGCMLALIRSEAPIH